MMTDPTVFLTQEIPLLPIWFALLGGLITTCIFWQACPRPALLTLLALLLLGLTTLAGPAINFLLIGFGTSQHWTTAQRGFYFMETGAILNIVRAVGYGLLFSAIFSGRRSPQLPPAGTHYPPGQFDRRTL